MSRAGDDAERSDEEERRTGGVSHQHRRESAGPAVPAGTRVVRRRRSRRSRPGGVSHQHRRESAGPAVPAGTRVVRRRRSRRSRPAPWSPPSWRPLSAFLAGALLRYLLGCTGPHTTRRLGRRLLGGLCPPSWQVPCFATFLAALAPTPRRPRHPSALGDLIDANLRRKAASPKTSAPERARCARDTPARSAISSMRTSVVRPLPQRPPPQSEHVAGTARRRAPSRVGFA